MSRRLLIVLLVLLLGGVSAAVALLSSGDRRPVAAPGRVEPDEAGGPAEGGRTELARQAPGTARNDAGREAVEAPETTVGSAADHSARWARPREARWVSGRVVLPPGTPLDEEIVVEAEGAAFPTAPDGNRFHRARVEDDGAFRVAFAPRTSYGRLSLVARFLYLEERYKVELDDPESVEDIELEPALGGLVLVRVTPPHHAAFSEEPLAGVTVEAGGGGFRSEGKEGWWTGREGEYEIGGLPPDEEYTIQAHSPYWADGRTEGVEVTAGRVTVTDVALSVGVRLSGTVVDEQGEPVHGAEVAAMSPEQAAQRMPFLNLREDTSRAEAPGGRFELDGVPPGELVLVAECDGYLDGHLDLGELGNGSERHDLLVRVDSGGELSGTVRWPWGDPAEGAVVRVAQGEALGGGRYEIERVKGELEVGPEGTFRFSGLEPESSCNVTATAIHPEDRPDPNSRVSLLRAKQIPRWVAGRDELRPDSPPFELVLSPGDVVSGKVVDDAGEPVESFFVLASPAGTGLLDASSRRPVRDRFRDEEGRFHLKGVQEGSWQVKVKAPGHAESERRPITVPTDGELLFTLPRAGSVSGRVVGPGGATVQSARVRGEHGGGRTVSTVGDKDGNFEVDQVSPGEVTLVGDGEEAAQSPPVVLQVGPGEDLEGVVLRLQPGATVVARVHPRAGPKQGRTVQLRRQGGDELMAGFPGRGSGRRSETTDAEGVAEFHGLDAGDYEVELQAPGGVEWNGDPESWLLRTANRSVAEVELGAGQAVEVVLGGPSPREVRVRGRITARGEPVSDGLVTAMDLSRDEDRPSAAVNADEDGRYELVLRNPGRWRFSVRAGQGDWTSLVEDVPEGEEHVLDFEIPEARITGLLTGPDGSPLPEMMVSLVDERTDGVRNNWFAQQRVMTDAEGRFEFEHLTPATYHLRAGGTEGGFGLFAERGDQYGRVIEVIEVVSEDEAIQRDVRLPAAGEIRGVVRDLSGQPVPRARIRVTEGSGLPLSQLEMVRSRPDGDFTYPGIGPGEYLVSARAGSGEEERVSEPREVRVYEGGSTDVTLVVE